MLVVALERTDGTHLKFSLPENPTELKLSQKIDFDFGQMEVISYLKKHEDNLFKSRAGFLLTIAKGLSRTFDMDLSTILNLKGVNFLEMDEVDFFNKLDQLGSQVKGVNKKQLEQSLVDIWIYLTNVINQADQVPIPEKITYKDREYTMPTLDRNPVTGAVIHRSITYKQAIEAIQVNNNYETWLGSDKDNKGTDKDAALLFTKYVSEVVLLLHTDEIPLDEDDFKIWLSTKILKFQDVDWQTANWIERWFQGYITELRSIPENAYFFESTFEASSPEEREAELKAKARGKKIYKRVGMKSVTAQLLELNPFQKEGQSKLESIMRAKFTQIVNLISSHNARS